LDGGGAAGGELAGPAAGGVAPLSAAGGGVAVGMVLGGAGVIPLSRLGAAAPPAAVDAPRP
jgi:hypothetical protein